MLVAVILAGILFAQAGPGREPGGVLGVLRKGQPVTLNDRGPCWEITVVERPGGPLGYEVVEVGSDYLVVKDIADMMVWRIPIYALKSVTTLHVAARPRTRQNE